MYRGYIKIWRKVIDSGLLQMPETYALFSFLLINAAHKPYKMGTKGGIITVETGQYVSGRMALARDLKQSERGIRTSLSRLCELEIISIKSTSKYSLYTIENYSNYQGSDQQNDQQTTSKRPANDQQTTTNQELKHLSIEELKDKSIVTSKLADACPHQKIVELYHEKLPTMPRVKDWTETRKKHLQARWREGKDRQSLEYWARFFDYVAESDFLCGRTAKPFNCDLEWLIKSANFVKIIEGKYVNT